MAESEFCKDILNTFYNNDLNRNQAHSSSQTSLNTTTNSSKMRTYVTTTCNFCEKANIDSDRYKCTLCDDYDLCSGCFSSARYNQNHKLNHPVLCIFGRLDVEEEKKLRVPNLLDYLANQFRNHKHSDAQCDQCNSDLIGIRLKCDACYNYDLCYKCWKTQKHDQNHPMIVYVSDILRKVSQENIQLGQLLGTGYFGSVYEAHLLPQRKKVACKTVDGRLVPQMGIKACVESLFREMNAHIEIRSAFICRLFGYSVNLERENFCLSILMEYMDNGSLSNIIDKENNQEMSIPLLRKIKMLGDVSVALCDIHNKKYIHADIKPDNILVTADFVCKISDFGTVKNGNIKEYNKFGSVLYLPPEFPTGKYDNTVDLYSLGLVMYNFLSGHIHTLNNNGLPVLEKLSNIRLPFIVDLIEDSTSLIPSKRHNAKFYATRLRYFSEIFTKLLDISSNQSSIKYKDLNTSEKDALLFLLYDDIIKICLNKELLQGKLKDRGFSLNQISLPEIDNFVTMTATALNYKKGLNSNIEAIIDQTFFVKKDANIQKQVTATATSAGGGTTINNQQEDDCNVS